MANNNRDIEGFVWLWDSRQPRPPQGQTTGAADARPSAPLIKPVGEGNGNQKPGHPQTSQK